jgi:curved DNA-binding protein CbpA
MSDHNFYSLLGIPPSASVEQIRKAYRELSKIYHPDTTTLPANIAHVKFQELHRAYRTLVNMEKRLVYDQQLRSRIYQKISSSPIVAKPVDHPPVIKTTHLDPIERPLSTGEIVASLMMAFTLIGCLVLAVAIALLRGEVSLELITPPA